MSFDALLALGAPTPTMRDLSHGEPEMFGGICTRVWGKRIDFSGMAAFLRARHPTKTAEAVEAECGVPARTVEKWLAGEAEPKGRHFIVLIGAYGPELLASILTTKPKWLDESVFIARREALDEKIAALKGERDLLRR